MTRTQRSIWLIAVCLLTASCEREYRDFRPDPSLARTTQWIPLTDLEAGGKSRGDLPGGVVITAGGVENRYEQNNYAISEGKRLFTAFNCNGCHGYGGGDIGPALMDDKWSYGSRPEQIFATIVEGRPNGMPTFGRKIAAYQVWQLVAYVRSLSGLVPSDAAPGRDDHMEQNPVENSRDREIPKDAGLPPAAERPE